MYIAIPDGTRDLIQHETAIKRELEQRIMNVFSRYMYEEVMTPAIEYYRTYRHAFGDLDDSQMYKFVDSDGEILTLRMDMTVPIARLAATKFNMASLPLRLSYSSDVYKVKKAFAGKRHTVTDCGIELIGQDYRGDLEVICIALDTLRALEVPGAFLEVGSAGFFQAACRAAGLDQEQKEILAHLIDSKALVELEEVLPGMNLSEKEREFFSRLPLLSGKKEALIEAEKLAFSSSMIEEIEKLKTLWSFLEEIGETDRIQFDLGKIPHLDYYTGLIFDGYCQGVGHSILSGGRYDLLLSKFGLKAEACGFSVKIDYLLRLFEAREEKVHIELRYPFREQGKALLAARRLQKDFPVLLIPDETVEKIEVNLCE